MTFQFLSHDDLLASIARMRNRHNSRAGRKGSRLPLPLSPLFSLSLSREVLDIVGITIEKMKSHNFVADDVQLGVVAAAAAVLVSLHRHLLAYRRREEDGPGDETEM